MVDVLVEDWLKLFYVIEVNLEMHKTMAEGGFTVGKLEVELGVLKCQALDLENFIHYLLI